MQKNSEEPNPSVEEAGSGPNPPDDSSLTSDSSGIDNQPPKGEIPKEGKMKSAKEYFESFGGWINENKNVFIFAVILVAFLVWNPIRLSSAELASSYAIVVAMIVLFMKPPFGLSKFLIRIAAIVFILGVVFFTWGASFNLSIHGFVNKDGVANNIVIPASDATLETRVTALEYNQNKVIVPALSIHEEALKLLGKSVDSLTPRVEKLEKKVDIPVSAAPKAEKKVEALLGSSSVASSTVSSSDSSSAPTITISTANGVTNTLAVDLYAFVYGDWDGKVIIKLEPGKTLKAGFNLGNGKIIQSGVHLNFFALYNNGKTWTLDEVIADPSRATYYWSQGLTPITGNTHYNKAFTIVDDNGAFLDGYKVTERMGGSNVAVAVDTFQKGRIPTRTMRF